MALKGLRATFETELSREMEKKGYSQDFHFSSANLKSIQFPCLVILGLNLDQIWVEKKKNGSF